jgi:hypothetical protein
VPCKYVQYSGNAIDFLGIIKVNFGKGIFNELVGILERLLIFSESSQILEGLVTFNE